MPVILAECGAIFALFDFLSASRTKLLTERNNAVGRAVIELSD
jgi:hypothetical protein